LANQRELALHLDLSPQSVSDLVRKGVFIINKGRSPVNIDACRVAYINHLRKAARYTKKDGSGDIAEEKTRLTKAQADAAEIKVLELEGLLLPVEMVSSNWSNLFAIVRVGLLGLANKIAHRLMAVKSVQEMKVIIDEEVYRILNELAESNGLPKEYADRGEKHNADIETTTKTNN
jgi:phage terminase Nu1 subunit (DNA packaging protein)